MHLTGLYINTPSVYAHAFDIVESILILIILFWSIVVLVLEFLDLG